MRTSAFNISRQGRLFFALDDDGDGSVPEADVRRALEGAGPGPKDDRLANLYTNLEANAGKPLGCDSFVKILGTSGLLVERALQGGLAIPDFADCAARVDRMFEAA